MRTGGPAMVCPAALRCERDHLVRLRHEEAGKAAIEAFFSKGRSSTLARAGV